MSKDSPDSPAPLSLIGMSNRELRDFGSIFRELAFHLTKLSTASFSEETAEQLKRYFESERNRLETTRRTKSEQKAHLIETLEADKRELELKIMQLELLATAVKADISRVQLEVEKIEAIISHLR